MPPIEVPWPPIYFVVECMTTAAPWSSGRHKTGAAVLSTISGTPSSRPIRATSPIGNTSSFGLGTDPANPGAALPLTNDWGLHPALKDQIWPLWQKGQVAFVPFAGADDMSRSHFETQDTIELGQPLGAGRDYGSGFMSRLNGQLGGTTPIAFTAQMPLIFRGGAAVPNIAFNQVGKPGVDARQARLIEGMYQGANLAGAVAEGFTVRDEVYQSVSTEMTVASRGAVAPKGFELSARRIARLMRASFNLGFVDVGGWDTHVRQGGTHRLSGRPPGGTGPGRAGYADELGPQAWNQTVVVVISEFGAPSGKTATRAPTTATAASSG